MDFRDFALPHLRATRKAAADLLAVIHKRRLDQGDLDPQSFKAGAARTEVACGILTLRNALGQLPKGFMGYEGFLPPPMTEEQAEALIQRALDDPDPYGWIIEKYPESTLAKPEEAAKARAAWIKDVREATKPIPDARPMLAGDEFLDADEAWELLNKVYLDLTTAGFQRHDETTPLKVEPEVVERLKKAIGLLDQFEERQDDDDTEQAPPVEDDDQDDRLTDILTKQQFKIVECLRDRNNGVGFDEIASYPGAFRDVPDDEAVKKALDRIKQRILTERLTIEVSATKRRAKLVLLTDK